MKGLVDRLLDLACDGEWCSPLAQEAAARVRELEAERDEARKQALEEAARLVEEFDSRGADEIRALISRP